MAFFQILGTTGLRNLVPHLIIASDTFVCVWGGGGGGGGVNSVLQ